jgi:TrkA-N domain
MSSHVPGSAPGQRATKGIWIIAIGVVLTLVLGASVEIFSPVASTPGCVAVEHESPYWFWRTFEILGPASFIATIAGVFWLLLEDRRKAWNIRHARNHLVVVGYGAIGRERASEGVRLGQRVIAIESKADEAATSHAKEHGVLVVEGDGGDDKILSLAQIDHAAGVVIATGDDARNLGLSSTGSAPNAAASCRPRSAAR